MWGSGPPPSINKEEGPAGIPKAATPESLSPTAPLLCVPEAAPSPSLLACGLSLLAMPPIHTKLSLPFPSLAGTWPKGGQICTVGLNTHLAEAKGSWPGHGEALLVGWGR